MTGDVVWFRCLDSIQWAKRTSAVSLGNRIQERSPFEGERDSEWPIVKDARRSGAGGLSEREGRLPGPEQDARFFQRRIVLWAKVLTLFGLAYYVLQVFFSRWSVDEVVSELLSASSSVLLLLVVANALVWTSCRRRPVPNRILHSIDVGGFLLYCGLLSLGAWSRREDITVMSGYGGVTFLVLSRAALVPSTATRTAVLSGAGYLPLFAIGYVTWISPGVEWAEGATKPSFFIYVAKGLFWITLSAVISRVIHGLRSAVRKAEQVGQYTLLEKLGQGGMGEVYRARHAMLQRPVAVKLLGAGQTGGQSQARFEREVQLTCKLTHPNTVTVYDYGRTAEGVFYYAMEFLDGVDLGTLVRACGPQSPDRVVHFLEQVCSSLQEAHASGLLHRDIKPANIILCERGWSHDMIKVVDFGLVKDILHEDDAGLSRFDAVRGTPHFMAPEFYRKRGDVDARSDLYSLGCVAYYLITGKHVFEGEGTFDILDKHVGEAPPRPSERVDLPVPAKLETAVLECLEKDPENRPESAESLRAKLQEISKDAVWTQADAEAWWRQHREEVRSERERSRGESPTSPSFDLGLPTVTEKIVRKE